MQDEGDKKKWNEIFFSLQKLKRDFPCCCKNAKNTNSSKTFLCCRINFHRNSTSCDTIETPSRVLSSVTKSSSSYEYVSSELCETSKSSEFCAESNFIIDISREELTSKHILTHSPQDVTHFHIPSLTHILAAAIMTSSFVVTQKEEMIPAQHKTISISISQKFYFLFMPFSCFAVCFLYSPTHNSQNNITEQDKPKGNFIRKQKDGVGERATAAEKAPFWEYSLPLFRCKILMKVVYQSANVTVERRRKAAWKARCAVKALNLQPSYSGYR